MIAYFIRKFPQLSETFIANEIVELARLGIEPRIYSYKRPTENVRHACVQLIRSPITYLPDPLYRHALQLLRAHLALRRSDPERYRATLRYALRNLKWKGQLRAWREFARAGYLAMHIKQDGITHIHSHMAHTATQVAMLVSMMTGVPYSFTARPRGSAKSRGPREAAVSRICPDRPHDIAGGSFRPARVRPVARDVQRSLACR